jgi:hypothetical protein
MYQLGEYPSDMVYKYGIYSGDSYRAYARYVNKVNTLLICFVNMVLSHGIHVGHSLKWFYLLLHPQCAI